MEVELPSGLSRALHDTCTEAATSPAKLFFQIQTQGGRLLTPQPVTIPSLVKPTLRYSLYHFHSLQVFKKPLEVQDFP